MKYLGRARKTAFKLIIIALVVTGCLIAMGAFAAVVGTALVAITPFLIGLWVVFALFTLYFFRDPTPRVPTTPRGILSPAHGKVDVIDTTVESLFMKGECRRVSIFLSVVDVHVQNAPISGRVALLKETEGKYLNALRTDCGDCNENVLMGIEPASTTLPKVAVRLIAGAIARRIVPFVQQGEEVSAGGRIGLIRFGSRVDLYLPLDAEIKVNLGDRVVGGETIVALAK